MKLLIVLVLAIFGSAVSKPLQKWQSDPSLRVNNLLHFPFEVNIPSYEIKSLTDRDDFNMKKIKRNHYEIANSGYGVDQRKTTCCPSIVEIIEPIGGKNLNGDLVELYQSATVRQRFYEVSCDPDFANRNCQFLSPHHTPLSRCTQRYSYTYALVREYGNENDPWKLDYIQVRSGCSCQIETNEIY